MDNDKHRDRIVRTLGQLGFDCVTPRFKQFVLADYAISRDNTLKFFLRCEHISDPISFRIGHEDMNYASVQAGLLGRIPGLIIGKDWKKFYIILQGQDYYSIFGNYPSITMEEYRVRDKMNPKLFWKKATIMIEDKRKRERTRLGKLRGIRVMAKDEHVIFTLVDFTRHLSYSLEFTQLP